MLFFNGLFALWLRDYFLAMLFNYVRFIILDSSLIVMLNMAVLIDSIDENYDKLSVRLFTIAVQFFVTIFGKKSLKSENGFAICQHLYMQSEFQ